MNTSAKYQANWTETVGVVQTKFCGPPAHPPDRLIPVYPPTPTPTLFAGL